MNKQDLVNYVIETPENTNPNVVSAMIDDIVANNKSEPKTYPLVFTNNSSKTVKITGLYNASNQTNDDESISPGETKTVYRLGGVGCFAIYTTDGSPLMFEQKNGSSWKEVELDYCASGNIAIFYCSRFVGVYSGSIFAYPSEARISDADIIG